MKVATAIIFAAISLNTATYGQMVAVKSAAITGTVTDPTGAPIPHSKVKATNTASGASLTTVTDNNGNFSISVPIGTYSVMFSSPLFESTLIRPVAVNADIKLTPTLRVSSVSETVEVEANTAQAVGIVEPGKKQTEYVRVGVNGVLGPMGYVATPSLTSANQQSGVDSEAVLASKNYNFPSIVLYISSAPVVYTSDDVSDQSKLDSIKSAQETNANPEWLDATFTLIPRDDSGKPISSACTDGSVQILGILPQATAGGTKTQTAANVASGINDTAGALASFYPGSSGLVSSATKALNVVFGDIFPPQSIAYQYSYMSGNCEFGWFFRPNLTAANGAGPASILGLQTGIVLLKTSKNIGQISVTGRTLSQWTKAPSTYNKKLYSSKDDIPTFVLPDPANIDFDQIVDLSAFPAMIPKKQAMAIAHVTTDVDWLALIKSAQLVTTPAADYVTNASLTAFITQKTATPPATTATGKVGSGTDATATPPKASTTGSKVKAPAKTPSTPTKP